MKHSVKEDSGSLVVGFEGDVDLQNSPQARKVLLEAVGRRQPVLVDLSSVSYIDSSGIACLVESLQAARKAGTAFALVAVSDSALRVLQLARLDTVFTIYGSLADGLAQAG